MKICKKDGNKWIPSFCIESNYISQNVLEKILGVTVSGIYWIFETSI